MRRDSLERASNRSRRRHTKHNVIARIRRRHYGWCDCCAPCPRCNSPWWAKSIYEQKHKNAPRLSDW